MDTEELTLLNSAAILQLSEKVKDQMAAIDDLIAVEMELAAVVSATAGTIDDLQARLAAALASKDHPEIAAVADRLRGLRDVLTSRIYVAPEVVAPVEPEVLAPVDVEVEAMAVPEPGNPSIGPNGAAITPTAAL